MRSWILPVALCAAGPALAASPEVFLPEIVRGVLLTGPLERSPFQFTPAKPEECERSEVMKMVLYRCKASGGQLQLSPAAGGGKRSTPTVNFTGVKVFYKPQKNGDVLREYHFQGRWTETVAGASRTTPVRWVLYRWNDQASEYLGFLELSDWGYTARALGVAP